MQINSKFRKVLGIRIGIGFFFFLVTLGFLVLKSSTNLQSSVNPLTVMACMLLLFLIYVAPDLFKIYKLIITEKGIEKTLIVTGQKQFIPFETINFVKKGKIKLRNRGGDISDGFHFSTLVFDNNKSLIISPDHFENYKDIMFAIESNL